MNLDSLEQTFSSLMAEAKKKSGRSQQTCPSCGLSPHSSH